MLALMVSPAFARPTPNRNSPYVIEVVLQDNRHITGEIRDRSGNFVSKFTAEDKIEVLIRRGVVITQRAPFSLSKDLMRFFALSVIQRSVFNGFLKEPGHDTLVTKERWFSKRGDYMRQNRLVMTFEWVK
jgi:hypothetical protein